MLKDINTDNTYIYTRPLLPDLGISLYLKLSEL